MASLGSGTLDSIPEEGQASTAVAGSSGNQADYGTQSSAVSTSSTTSNSKWDTLRKLVKRQTLQFVGLEHPESTQTHQDALQRSIIVGKVAKKLETTPSSEYSCEPSLFKAIIPHETVSPVTTHSLLRQLSVRSDLIKSPPPLGDVPSATSTPYTDVAKGEKQKSLRIPETIELDSIKPKISEIKQTSFDFGMSSTRQRSLDRPPLEHSISLPTRTTSYDESTLTRTYLHKPTGRLQALEVEETEAKPDLWKIAFLSLRFLSKARPPETQPLVQTDGQSFDVIHEEEETNEDDGIALMKLPPPAPQLQRVDSIDSTATLGKSHRFFNDEDFFGGEHVDGRAGRITTERTIMTPITEEPPPDYFSLEPKPEEDQYGGPRQRRRKLRIPRLFSKQHREPYQVLGGVTFRLLNFRYKHVHSGTRQKLEELERSSLHRPFFTYWLMTVQIFILIFSLAVYGFAPYGFDQFTERALIQQSNLAVEVQERNITPNVWGGPPQDALVLLGAKYGPCMRYDRQLYRGIDNDIFREGNSSGCCVRKDQSGCVQVSSEDKCPELFADFVFRDNSTSGFSDRAVCGTSPMSCITPDPSRDSRWRGDITEWPICTESQDQSNSRHLTCTLTGRPCCVGIQAHCLITTQEHCSFLQGKFHSDAFLCSQVDCLSDICGLLPFGSMNNPDQFYRVWTSLFLHAGIIHLVFTLTFHFLILRHVEKYLGWLRTLIIYIGSGIGGNIVSAVFVPYNPEVGPAGGIFGIIAFFLIYIMYQAHRLVKPWLEALKLMIIIIILLCCGLFPFIDNFAHLGGFVFGILLSGIFAPYYRPLDAELAYYRDKHRREYNPNKDWIQISKYIFIVAGLPLVIALYVLFFVLFYVVQDTWDGFQYLNCIPFTKTFCLNFGQNIRSRDIFL